MSRDDRRLLIGANVALLAAMALHAADHYRQERGVDALTGEVLWGGVGLFAVAFASLTVTVRGHSRAPLLAAVTGLWIALGVTASHFAPHWSSFSDSYAALDLDAFSWMAAAIEVAAALGLAAAAFRVASRERVSAPRRRPKSRSAMSP
jgi:hypothetical protein